MDQALYREITGLFTARVQDSADTDHDPDLVPLEGSVLFTPEYRNGAIAFPTLREFIAPQEINATLIGGELRVAVVEGDEITYQPLRLMVTEDDRGTQRWTWRAQFRAVTLEGEPYSISDFRFTVPVGDGPLDLTEVVGTSGGGFITVQGPAGPGLTAIQAVDGKLVFDYTDGRTTEVDVPDAVPGPAGPANALSVGSVTVVDDPEDADVEITGDAPSQTLSIALPRGPKGDPAGDDELAAFVQETGSQTRAALREVAWDYDVIDPLILPVTSARFPQVDDTGQSDAGPALTALLASPTVREGARVLLRGSYRIATTVQVPADKRLTLDFTGGQITLAPGVGVGFSCVQPFETQYEVTGQTTETIVIDDTATEGGGTTVAKLTIPGASAAGWAPGDVIKILADDTIPDSHYRNTTTRPRVGEFAIVHAVTDDQVWLRNTLFESYTDRPRAARLPYATVTMIGGTWDVDDAIVAGNETAHFLRLTGLQDPQVVRPRFTRLMGMGVSVKSCWGYTVRDVTVERGKNDVTTGIYGYGVHDSSCESGLVEGGVFRALRHAWTDGTSESVRAATIAGSDPADHGRPKNTRLIGVTCIDSTTAGFDTHSTGYNQSFIGCHARVTGQTNGFSLRGTGQQVIDCTVHGGSGGVYVFTQITGSYAPSESRRHVVRGLKTVGTRIPVRVNVRNNAVHPNHHVKDDQPTITVSGLYAEGCERGIDVINSRVRLRDCFFEASPLVAGSFFLVQNSDLDAADVTVDLSKVESTSAAAQLLLADTNTGYSSTLLIRDFNLAASATVRSAYTALFRSTNSGTGRVDVDARLSDTWDETNTQIIDLHANIPRVVRWDYPANENTLATSGRLVLANQYINTSRLRGLIGASDPTLVLTANVTDSTARSLGAIPHGRRQGQILSIVLGSATAPLTVQHGASYNTRTKSGADVVLSAPGDRINFMFSEGAWREL